MERKASEMGVLDDNKQEVFAAQASSNPFEILGVPPVVSLPELEDRFLSLQTELHPDRFIHASGEDRLTAEKKFAQVVWAYGEIQNPLNRIEHILKIKGAWPAPQDPEILEELLELQEAFEFLDLKADLEAANVIGADLHESIQESLNLLKALMQQEDWEGAAIVYGRVRPLVALYGRLFDSDEGERL